MTGRFVPLLAASLQLCALGSWSTAALAEPSVADRTTAAALFDAARDLIAEEKYEEACPKLAESQRLQPAHGTQLNLAACYEKIGKTASAWINYSELAITARKAGDDERADLAKERVEALKGQLSKLQIDVPKPVEGLEIRRGATPVPRPAWGSAVAVDPGSYEIVASAPGKKPWSTKVTVDKPGELTTVEIPALADKPAEPDTADGAAGGTQRIVGYVVGGAGIAALGVGVALLPVAKSKDDEASSHCNADGTVCDAEGFRLRGQAINTQTAGIVLMAAGGAAVAGGLVLWLTAPSKPKPGTTEAWTVTPIVGPGIAGATLGARF